MCVSTLFLNGNHFMLQVLLLLFVLETASGGNAFNFVSKLTEHVRSRRSTSDQVISGVPVVHPGVSEASNLQKTAGKRVRKTEYGSRRNEGSRIPCANCHIRKRRISISKPSCNPKTVRINTCQGYCESWEVPHYEAPYYKKRVNVCQPVRLEVKYFVLSGCRNSTVAIAVPTQCGCGPCNPNTTACRPFN